MKAEQPADGWPTVHAQQQVRQITVLDLSEPLPVVLSPGGYALLPWRVRRGGLSAARPWHAVRVRTQAGLRYGHEAVEMLLDTQTSRERHSNFVSNPDPDPRCALPAGGGHVGGAPARRYR